ncbi:hypothetical protein HDU97_005720 [Phlyctochytrium planicorne]|nr:hypothetical protein HDU97_005720 [Phlyctochytrium planicorne]
MNLSSVLIAIASSAALAQDAVITTLTNPYLFTKMSILARFAGTADAECRKVDSAGVGVCVGFKIASYSSGTILGLPCCVKLVPVNGTHIATYNAVSCQYQDTCMIPNGDINGICEKSNGHRPQSSTSVKDVFNVAQINQKCGYWISRSTGLNFKFTKSQCAACLHCVRDDDDPFVGTCWASDPPLYKVALSNETCGYRRSPGQYTACERNDCVFYEGDWLDGFCKSAATGDVPELPTTTAVYSSTASGTAKGTWEELPRTTVRFPTTTWYPELPTTTAPYPGASRTWEYPQQLPTTRARPFTTTTDDYPELPQTTAKHPTTTLAYPELPSTTRIFATHTATWEYPPLPSTKESNSTTATWEYPELPSTKAGHPTTTWAYPNLPHTTGKGPTTTGAYLELPATISTSHTTTLNYFVPEPTRRSACR